MARMSAEERRTRLVHAAIAVMSRDGVAQTTTRMIVAEAEMQIGVFHYCFRSKEELLFEVLRTLNERSFGAVGLILGESRSTADAIRFGLAAYWDHVRAHAEERLLIFELMHHALRLSGHEDSARDMYANYHQGVREFLAVAARLDGVTFATDLDVLSRFTIAHMQGVTLQWLVQRDEAMAVRLLSQLAAHLLGDAGIDGPSDVPHPAPVPAAHLT